jgi:hypothetical protein
MACSDGALCGGPWPPRPPAGQSCGGPHAQRRRRFPPHRRFSCIEASQTDGIALASCTFPVAGHPRPQIGRLEEGDHVDLAGDAQYGHQPAQLGLLGVGGSTDEEQRQAGARSWTSEPGRR